MDEGGVGGIRLRAACDRCHSQKLRCLKAAAAEKCDRCCRAGALCEFSPFRQKKKPNECGSKQDRASVLAQLANLEDRISMVAEKNQVVIGAKRKRLGSVERPEHPSVHDSSDSSATGNPLFQIDQIISSTEIPVASNWGDGFFPLFNDSWPDHTFDDLDLETFGQLPPVTDSDNHRNKTTFQLRNSPRNSPIRFFEPGSAKTQSDPPVVPPWFPSKNTALENEINNHINTVHPKSEKHLVHQLSQLSIGLYEHISTIPPQSIHDPLPEGAQHEPHTGYAVDQTFKLTQDLIDIYPVFIDTFLKKSSSESCSPVNVANQPTPPDTTTYEDLIRLPSPLHVAARPNHPTPRDHSSVLLLLSCHVRLIDIYDELFAHMARCVDTPGPNVACVQCDMYMPPPVKIGTFTPPPSSSIPMQMMLLIQQASQLSDSAAELASHLKGPTPEGLDGQKPRDDAAIPSLVMAEKVKGRASFMSQQLSAMRTEILSRGFLA